MKKIPVSKGIIFFILSLLIYPTVNAQYLETFSTDNKGYVFNFNDDFTGVDWTLSPWSSANRLYDDYFQTFSGKLNGEEFGEEVCWQSPLLNISTAGSNVSISVDLSWESFEAEDYIDLAYSVDEAAYTNVVNLVGGGTHTIQYLSGTSSGSTTVNISGLSGNTLGIKVCIYTNDTLEYTTIDNISVPQTGVSLACVGNVSLSSQAEVDAFDCTLITGNLTISGADITDLSPLSSLSSVGGLLSIYGNTNLSNLNGLSSITSVSELTIIYNPILTNLNGLTALTSVSGTLDVEFNYALSEFCGLFPLLNSGGLGGSYYVSSNAVNPTQQDIIDGGACPVVCTGNITLSTQAEVDAFICNEIVGNLTIQSIPPTDITNLDALSSLTSVSGDVYIGNSYLSDIGGLSSLTSVGGGFRLQEMPSLEDLSPLTNLTSIGGTLWLSFIKASDLSVFSSLTSVGSIALLYNYTYTGTIDFSSITTVQNITLNNLSGNFVVDLSSLVSANTIHIESSSLSGMNLSGLTTLTGYLNLTNTKLTSLDVLSSLTSVSGFVKLIANDQLQDLNGLSALTSVGDYLNVSLNGGLTEFCGLYPLLNGGGLVGSYTVSGNASNPTAQEIVDGGPCLPAGCDNFQVNLKDSNGDLLAGGSLEYREGGGSGWQTATEISDGVFCIDTQRSQVGLRMTFGPQVLKVSEVPTNTDYTFQMEEVTIKLREYGVLTDNGEVDYTSDGWHYIGVTGDNGTGLVKIDMLPTTYTFRMNYYGDKELKQRTISPSYHMITFHVEDLKSTELSGVKDSQLVAYPNPFSGNTTIAFSLEETQEVNISVYDQTGRLIEVLHDGIQTEGNHKIGWDASEVNTGIYILRLSTAEQVAHKNIVKM